MLALVVIFGVVSWHSCPVMAWLWLRPSPSVTAIASASPSMSSCYSWQFRCDNGWQCISRSWLCDGDRDCNDGSDEYSWNCATQLSPMQSSKVQSGTVSSAVWPARTILPMASSAASALCPSWRPFRCSYGGQCMWRYQVCDGRRDCYDGSDEWHCSSARITPSPTVWPARTALPMASSAASALCPSWRPFRCSYGGQCMRRYQVCDGRRDCYDGSDEWHCSSARITPSSTVWPARTALPMASSAASALCPSWRPFRCSYGGQCMWRYQVCDGRRDCYDGSDEWHCSSARITPSPTASILPVVSSTVRTYCSNWWAFRCSYGGQCISSYQVCDGRWDCYDGSDERHCFSSAAIMVTASIINPYPTAVLASRSAYVCPAYRPFQCANGVECIEQRKVCDGQANCADRSDEQVSRCQSNFKRCQNKIDLGFILDSSGSVPRNDFNTMKEFVKDLTSYFTISLNESRVSVMSFSSQVQLHIPFNRVFSNKQDLDNAIDYIGYSGGGTATALALNSAYSNMFTQRNGARGTEIKKVLIILTDGRSNTGQVSGPAQRLKNSGVVVFSVGIGPHLSMLELREMASQPSDRHVIQLHNFTGLSTLANQMSSRTCNAAHFLVLCGNDAITAVFYRSDLSKHVSVDRLYLRDQRCKATYNSTHVLIKTSLSGCGTVYSESEQTMFFSNTLTEKAPSSSGGVITRDHLFQAKFTCRYGRKQTVGSFSFEPAKQTLFLSSSGEGNLTLTIDFYKSSSFVRPYTMQDYPVFTRLSDNIYIQYSVKTTNTDLVVQAETCRATPTNRPYDQPQYVFIANSCDNDSTIRHFGSGLSSVKRFSIQAFRFIAQHRFVYIHCDLVVCNRNYGNSTCARAGRCSTRYRRDVNKSPSEDTAKMYPLAFGPMMLSESAGENAGKSKSGLNKSVIGSLIGVGCLAIVLAGALVFVINRGRPRRRVSPTPITHVIPMENVGTST